jgi:hypothetical protein
MDIGAEEEGTKVKIHLETSERVKQDIRAIRNVYHMILVIVPDHSVCSFGSSGTFLSNFASFSSPDGEADPFTASRSFSVASHGRIAPPGSDLLRITTSNLQPPTPTHEPSHHNKHTHDQRLPINTVDMRSKFKDEHPFEKRKAEAERIVRNPTSPTSICIHIPSSRRDSNLSVSAAPKVL